MYMFCVCGMHVVDSTGLSPVSFHRVNILDFNRQPTFSSINAPTLFKRENVKNDYLDEVQPY